jgi:hypothetical protein
MYGCWCAPNDYDRGSAGFPESSRRSVITTKDTTGMKGESSIVLSFLGVLRGDIK